MKENQIKFRFLIVLGFTFVQSLQGQTYTVTKLPELLKLADLDSVQKIERLAALDFHKLINEYRKINRLVPLAWDDALWLTCRNHDIWMGNQGDISHGEKKGTKFYTGDLPNERYEFATSKKGGCHWSGENTLYNYSAYGNTISEIAEHIALNSIQQWKDSPGHNENMLRGNHRSHGVAFYLKNGKVYATDLFASNIDDQFNKLTPQLIENNFVINVAHTCTKVAAPSEKKVKLNTHQLELDLINGLYTTYAEGSKVLVKKNKTMEKASTQHSKYMCAAKQLTHKEFKNKQNFSGENESKRMKKASRGFYYLFKPRIKITESVAFLEVDAKGLDVEKLTHTLQMQLDKDKKVDAAKIEVGYGVSINRTKNQLRLYVTRIVGNKAS